MAGYNKVKADMMVWAHQFIGGTLEGVCPKEDKTPRIVYHFDNEVGHHQVSIYWVPTIRAFKMYYAAYGLGESTRVVTKEELQNLQFIVEDPKESPLPKLN
jgi:hypothetical protein